MGIFGVVLSLLVFNLGIAVPIFSLALSKAALANTAANSSVSYLDEASPNAQDNATSEEEEEQRTPIPGAEEENEKSRETDDVWAFFNSSTKAKQVILEEAKIVHHSYEVSTPPPEQA